MELLIVMLLVVGFIGIVEIVYRPGGMFAPKPPEKKPGEDQELNKWNY